MQNQILKECLRQLIKVYAFAEQQYIYLSIQSHVPILKVFFEQRAYERMMLMDEIEMFLSRDKTYMPPTKTLEQLYNSHKAIYGRNSLKTIHVLNVDTIIIDEKSLEICNCLLSDDFYEHEYIRTILKSQSATLESSILSMVYLKALYES